MADLQFNRGDRYAITCPLMKDGVAFDTTTGGPWTVTATLAQNDAIEATTEIETPLKTTLSVQNATTGCMVTICNSTLLLVGIHLLEIQVSDGILSYTWPFWAIQVVEPKRI